jgi:2-succinyl-5-enolpyruvyl-6-hydroxy-3-cyclohexene-1-carboxylate synthase
MSIPRAPNDSADSVATASGNWLRASVIMATLQKAGVSLCVLSPGSRSAPLALAAARTPDLAVWVAVDERSAGFIALGHARRSRQPVVLLCTSGSAPAHYFPAIIEASEAGVPLIILSADRPPELRNCGAGQTIDQIELFGGYVRHFVDCILPLAADADVSYCCNTVRHALAAATGTNPGPVHLNLPFREPLVPSATALREMDFEWIEQHLQAQMRPHATIPIPGQANASRPIVDLPSPSFWSQRGLILVGSHPPQEGSTYFTEAVLSLSRQLRWPVFADPGNALRYQSIADGPVIGHYDVLLRDPAIARDWQPEAVLQIGALPTAKVLRQWLSGFSHETIIIDPRPRNLDPLHRAHRRWYLNACSLMVELQHCKIVKTPNEWLAGWQQMDRSAAVALAQCVDAYMQSGAPLCEPLWPHLLTQSLSGVECDFHFASSMPIRDAEWFIPCGLLYGEGFANRGANGIDGTLSTVIGAAHRNPRPMLLVCGDLAFLHDSNAFLSAAQLQGSLTILLIDNNGGRIFESLPIAEHEAEFERYFATPQAVDCAQLAAAHNIPFSEWTLSTALTALRQAVHTPGIKILRMHSDNNLARQMRRNLFTAMKYAANQSGAVCGCGISS